MVSNKENTLAERLGATESLGTRTGTQDTKAALAGQ